MENKKNETIKLTLEVSKEQFVSEDDKVIKYYSYTVTIGDESFRLCPRPDDKRMLNYMLNDLFNAPKEGDETL